MRGYLGLLRVGRGIGSRICKCMIRLGGSLMKSYS